MSGQTININQLYTEYGGECCLSRTVLGDWSPITYMRGGGRFFVTNSANCASPIAASAYPATFDYVYVCGGKRYDYVDGGELGREREQWEGVLKPTTSRLHSKYSWHPGSVAVRLHSCLLHTLFFNVVRLLHIAS